MIVRYQNSNFEPCPEFNGRGVCVDVTPLKKQQSQFGERDVFKLVFEVDADRDDGSRFCVWSNNLTPSLHEKANLRKLLKSWFGRDLSKAEMDSFDTETLIGKAAHLVVVQEHKGGETYAKIALLQPGKPGEPLQPSGKYVRVKDRKPKDGGGYRRAEQPAGEAQTEHLAVKVHVGRCKGLELRDLASEQVAALVEKWLPTAKANAKPTADDKRLVAALEWWQSNRAGEEDNVPY